MSSFHIQKTMSKKMSNLSKAQKCLYLWLSNFENRSYNLIRRNCDYLNIQYNLGIETYAVWKIFYPLVYSGVVEHTGNGYYALTEPTAIDFGAHYALINMPDDTPSCNTQCVGISLLDKISCNILPSKVVTFNVAQALSSFPPIKSVVDGFYESIVDIDKLEYHDFKTRRGVAELKEGGLKRYFSIPEEGYLRQIPDKAINPDALNISYYLERVVNNQYNGNYNKQTRQLHLEAFGLPILVHRVLMLDCLSRKHLPVKTDHEYLYDGITPKVVKELNRILNKSIKIDE